MVWVLAALLVGAAIWLALTLKKERTERITLDEMMLLAEEARKSSPLATALQHRQVLRESRGDPDGGDPVLTDTDRMVREVAKLSRRIMRARTKRDRLAARREHLSKVESASPSDVEKQSSSLDEALERKQTELEVLQGEIDRMLRMLEDVSAREKATVDGRLRPAPQPAAAQAAASEATHAPASSISQVAVQAAQMVQEITSPHGRLVTADGPPMSERPPVLERAAPQVQPTEKVRRVKRDAPTVRVDVDQAPPLPSSTPPASSPPPARRSASARRRSSRDAPGSEAKVEATKMRGERVLGRNAQSAPASDPKPLTATGTGAGPRTGTRGGSGKPRAKKLKVRTSPKVRSIQQHDDEATELAPRP